MVWKVNSNSGQWENVSGTDVEGQVHQEIQKENPVPQVDLHAVVGEQGIKELKDSNIDPNKLNDINTPEAQGTLDSIVRYHTQKKQIQAQADKLVNENPALYAGFTGIGANPTAETSKAILRPLSFGNNLVAGYFKGVYNVINGKGSFLDGISDYIKGDKNFGNYLEEVGVPKGPEFQARLPKFDPVAGIVKSFADRQFQAFGPKLSSRGLIGLAGDIAFDPLSYVEFAPNTAKRVLKAAGESKPLVKFADTVLLNEEGAKTFASNVENGFKAMKATKVGQAAYEMMDRFLGHEIYQGKSLKDGIRSIGEGIEAAKDGLGHMLIPGYGDNKYVYDTAHKVEREILQAQNGIKDSYTELAKNFTDDEKLNMFNEIFSYHKQEAEFGKGTLPRINFSNPRFAQAYDKMFTQVRDLAKRIGMPEDILYNNYVPSIFKNIEQTAFKRTPGLSKIARTGARFKKEFVENANLIRDPFVAFGERMSEMVRVERLNNGFINKIVEKFGKPEEYINSMNKGIEEFFPLETAKDFFKGTRFENDLLTKPSNVEDLVKSKGFKDLSEAEQTLQIVDQGKRSYVDSSPLGKGVTRFQYQQLVKKAKQLDPTLRNAVRNGLSELDRPVFLPEKIVKSIQNVAKNNKLTTNDLLKVTDAFTNKFWKAMQTSIFPAFNVRNWTNNMFSIFQTQGPKAVFKAENDFLAYKILSNTEDLGKTTIKSITGQEYSLSKLKKLMNKAGIIDYGTESKQLLQDFAAKTSQNQFVNKWVKAMDGFAQSDFISKAREMAQGIESHAKARVYIKAIQDGFSPKEATKLVWNTLFDYSSLTHFEKNFAKRVMPFWTFTKNNTFAQAERLLHYPGRQAVLPKIYKALYEDAVSGLSPEKKEAFNDYKDHFMNSSFAIPTGTTKDGKIMWFTGIGVGQEDVMDLMTDPAGQGFFRLNPLVKALVPKSVAFKDQYDFSELKQFHVAIPMIKKDMSDEDLTKVINSPEFQKFPLVKLLGMRVVDQPQYKNGRRTGETKKIIQTDRKTVSLMTDLLISRGWSSARMLNNPDIDGTQKLAQFVTGMQFYQQIASKAIYRDKAEMSQKASKVLGGSYSGGEFKQVFSKRGEAKGLAKRINKLRG